MVPNITFHFKDGSTRKSLKGYKVPLNEQTKQLYVFLINHKMPGEEGEREKK